MQMRGRGSRWVLPMLLLLVVACERSTDQAPTSSASTTRAAVAAPRRDPLAGGPYPTLFLAVAQFTDVKQPDGKTQPIPGAAKLLIVRKTESGWKVATLE